MRIGKVERVKNIALHTAEGKKLYELHVKTVQSKQLKGLVDTKWRSHLQVAEEREPVWRVLYKLPLTKRVGDLQWRILHCAVSTGRFLHRVDPSISAECCFCGEEETVFHAFSDCVRLGSFFYLLQGLLQAFGVIFSKEIFIFGFPYSFKSRNRSVLINFILGQAKLAILQSRKNTILEAGLTDVVRLFRILAISRVMVDFNYFKMVSNLEGFQDRWCVGDALCSLSEEGELLFNF